MSLYDIDSRTTNYENEDELIEMCKPLGADVSFFVKDNKISNLAG